jgi:GNAT superfamily N-acetyltransferase
MFQIRLATVHDAPLILRFIQALAAFERQPDAVKVTEDVLRAQLSLSQPPFECLIAEVDAAPAGFALFFTSYSTWLGKPGIWLEDLFVLPEVRRQGLGTALLRRLGELAAERCSGRLEWSVLDWNQPAIDFYASLGAQVMGEWRICRVEGAAFQNFVSRTTEA